MKKAIPITILVLILIAVVYYMSTQFTYSEGERAGMLIKFSKKGYVFKTYEGELNLGSAVVNNMWDFSVTNATVADSLMHMEGRHITVHYKQVVRNWSWQGETPYFVDKVSAQ